MAASVSTAKTNAWGGIWRDQDVEEQQELLDDQIECFVCLGAIPLNVRFKPCGHCVCAGCAVRLRRAQIFKATQVLSCPMCRRHVDYLECVDDSDLEAKRVVLDASAESKSEKQKEKQKKEKPAPQPPPQATPKLRPPPTVSTGRTWKCPSHQCGFKNSINDLKCKNCLMSKDEAARLDPCVNEAFY